MTVPRQVKQALINLGVPADQIEIGKRPLYRDLDGIITPGFRLKFEDR